MTTENMQLWLDKLGYSAEPELLHLRGEAVPESHPYGVELKILLHPKGAIRAQAVFDVEGVPTVVFLGDDGAPLTSDDLDGIRKRIWNQNLATILIEVTGDTARALPVRRLHDESQILNLFEASPNGPFSALEVASANLLRRKPAWFDVTERVDRKLLENLSVLVSRLSKSGFQSSDGSDFERRHAELLTGQLLFISYLEHRDIVGATYRERRNVSPFHSLIANMDREGVRALIDSLRQDFNGDFLSDDRHDPWSALSADGFSLLDSFLRHTEMKTGQGSFWNYDFSFIPVELLSGLYESFLSAKEQAKTGAYYTPRHLAMLAVDQAFATSSNPLAETIFDGACGSGILLTTAYRRLIALAESRAQRTLTFRERRDMLVTQIFGSDINSMACRVTAFSLYLSLLEGLKPADILEAQQRERIKLPSLGGKNLLNGAEGDFFDQRHGFLSRTFSLIISNPPWSEPEGDEVTSADSWALRTRAPFVRRQIAGAYTLRSREFLAEGGRVCLILPIGQFLGRSSAAFVSHTLRVFRPTRIINFGDLQNLLFPSTEHTCHVFIGVLRSGSDRPRISVTETFDYLVPKADISLAYGRLSMQSADRHTVQTLSVIDDPQILVTLMWGDVNDLAIWTRLSLRSTFADFWSGPKDSRRWVNRKGVHLEDKSRSAVSADPLRDIPFIPIAALSAGSPVLNPTLLVQWPEDQQTVAGITDDLLEVFDGPRVLFPDGFSRKEQTVRAVYFDGPATFTHSIGVMAGPREDALLLQFAAVYLRSTLARYFLMLRAWKMLCERNGVHLADVESFPFFDSDSAPNPESAKQALRRISDRMSDIAQLSAGEQPHRYNKLRDAFDNDIFEYFDLSDVERRLIRETVSVLMPSIRPRSFKSLNTPAQKRAGTRDFAVYADTLASSLTRWRERMGGEGSFEINVTAGDPEKGGLVGIVRISYADERTDKTPTIADINEQAVQQALVELRRSGLSVIPSGDALQLVPDAHIWINGELFLVRPLTQRSWTIRQALRDAENLVRTVQSRQAETERKEFA